MPDDGGGLSNPSDLAMECGPQGFLNKVLPQCRANKVRVMPGDCVEQNVEHGARGDDFAQKVFGRVDRGRRLQSFGVLLEDADPCRETVKASKT